MVFVIQLQKYRENKKYEKQPPILQIPAIDENVIK